MGIVLLSSNMMLERFDSPLLKRLNQLFLLDLYPAVRLWALRLGGLVTLSSEVELPSR